MLSRRIVIMSIGFPYFPAADARELELLRGRSLWLTLLGTVLVVLGALAISFPKIASVDTALIFGVLLLIGGALQISLSVWASGWSGVFSSLLVGLLYLFLGVVLIDRPVLAASELTLLLAVFMVAAGLIRAVVALSQRFSGWGWSLLNGAVTLLLGILIWRHWPGDGVWVIGMLVGIELVFSGWSLVMLGLAVRSMTRPAIPA
jgi:uncharacterized membrane protein HdeD (DUF308 family)